MIAGINTAFPLPFTGIKSPGPPDVYAGNAPGEFGYREPETVVFIETKANSKVFETANRIDWREITTGIDGDETTCSLDAALDADDLGTAGTIGTRHLSHLLEILSPDKRVLIVQPQGATAGRILFCGYPMPASFDWSARGQSVSVVCVDAGRDRLDTGFDCQIRGRRMRYAPLSAWNPADPDDALVEALPLQFNPGGRPNRSSRSYPFEIGTATHKVHLFVDDDETGAQFWRYVDALRYILLHHVLKVPGGPPVSAQAFFTDTAALVDQGELAEAEDPFKRLITAQCEDLDCRSVSASEALTLLCDEARLHWAIDTANTGTAKEPTPEHRLRVWATLEDDAAIAATPERTMGVPKIDDLPREAPYTPMADRTAREIAEANAIVQARLTLDNRRVQPIHTGPPKLLEVTLLLRPWWLPHAQLDNLVSAQEIEDAEAFWVGQFYSDTDAEGTIISQYHSKHPDFAAVKDVARLWAFPDVITGIYPENENDSPYARINWPAQLYSPFDPNDRQSLVYAHATLGAGIAAAREWVPRRRPFLSTIGRREGATDRSPVVWINFDATDPLTALAQEEWLPLTHGCQIDQRRAAVWITADNLLLDANLRDKPENPAIGNYRQYLKAYLEGRCQVAVTCCIAADDRLYYEAAPQTGGPVRTRYQLCDLGDETYPYGDRSHNVMADDFVVDDEPAYSEIDSTPRFTKFADRDAAYKNRRMVSGPVDCFWLEVDRWKTGDGFSGCSGLGIEFDRYPAVRRVQLRNGPGGHRTILHLTDLRETPEEEAAA